VNRSPHERSRGGNPGSEPSTDPTTPTVADPSDVPHVVAARVVTTRHTRLVSVHCPYCGRRHGHGVPFGNLATRHRLAECGRGEYAIVLPDEVSS